MDLALLNFAWKHSLKRCKKCVRESMEWAKCEKIESEHEKRQTIREKHNFIKKRHNGKSNSQYNPIAFNFISRFFILASLHGFFINLCLCNFNSLLALLFDIVQYFSFLSKRYPSSAQNSDAMKMNVRKISVMSFGLTETLIFWQYKIREARNRIKFPVNWKISPNSKFWSK